MGWRWEAVKAGISGRGGGLSQFFMPRASSPPARNTQEWLETFGKSPRLAPVAKIATDLSIIPGRLLRRDADKETEITEHPFLDFWENPNPLPEMSASALWRLMEIYLLISGEAFALIERDAHGMPAELWPIPPHWVLETPRVGFAAYRVRQGDGTNQIVPPSDIFVMRELNPTNPYKRGLGMAEALADEIETDEYMAKYNKYFFYNNASSGTILSVPGMQKEQFDRFEETWNARHKGVRNAHKLGIIPREVSSVKIADTQREMDYAQSRKDLRDSSNQHFGVPPEIMGVVENSNRATATQAKIIYAENVQMPRLLARQNAVNQQLLAFWGDNLFWEFDDIVPEDQDYRLQMTNEGLTRGALLIDEWREQNGFDHINGGDVLTMPYAVIITKPADLTTQSALQSAGETHASNTVTPDVTCFLIPWLRARVGETRMNQLQQIASFAVSAAEQLYKNKENEEKLEYALERVNAELARCHLTFDAAAIQAAIEAAVIGLKRDTVGT